MAAETNEKNTKLRDETKHLIRNLLIRESQLTISVSGIYSKYLQLRDLTLTLKEFKLNCSGVGKDSFHSEVLDESIFIVNGFGEMQSLPLDEALKRVLFFFRNDIVANQKLAILSGFKPIQTIKYAGSSLLSPLYKPLYKAYHLGYLGFILGLGEGVQDFYGFFSKGSHSMVLLVMKNISKL